MPVTAHTRLAVLLGDPVAHSRSPELHTAAFRAAGVDAVYLACRVRADGLPEAVAGLRTLGFLGANVTVPHKQAAAGLADRLTPTAEATGAVNTLFWDEDALVGDNTDVAGFLSGLSGRFSTQKDPSAVVLGAGGSARAVVYGLLREVGLRRLSVAARRPEAAEALCRQLSSVEGADVLEPVALPEAGARIRAAALVVNATPLGMPPHADTSPWPHAADFGRHQLVYDLVYGSAPTPLLREAAARGAATQDGRAMLLGQAAAAFQRWTGRPMPLQAVREALGWAT